MTQTFVITGASGFIGSQLVPRLQNLGCALLLVGRDTIALNQVFPDIPSCSYEDIAERAQGFDALIHLAVLNNNVQASNEEFIGVNVGLLSQVIAAAKEAGIRRFVNVTSFQAIDGSRSPYANSKRAALQALNGETDIAVLNLFVPAVFGDDFAGRLSFLKQVPKILRQPVFLVLSALVPTLHIDRLVSILDDGIGKSPRHIMLANPQEQNTVYCLARRTIDLMFSVVVIGLFGWLLALVWLLIRVSSSGPGIFMQERVGKDGQLFTCYKFRTMKNGTKQAGTHEVSAHSVTKIGAFLRRTKIDELPQAWNIFRGELSLVGPRPCLPMQKELIGARERLGVLRVVPGMTGLAQINGVDMSDANELAKIDSRYIAQRGLLLDIKIIFATLLGRGQGDKVR